MINWADIDTVLLDMDGTLLDLHYDNFFWTRHLPRRFAEIHGGDHDTVSAQLMDRILSERGTLNWYCLDYWSKELNLDISALKKEVAHLIALRPACDQFLEALELSGCRTWLVTNAHRDGLDLKLAQTNIGRWLQQLISSHDFALPKEDPRFWEALQRRHHFDPSRALLIDDNTQVLDSAARFGIGHLLTIAQPDSRQPPRRDLAYPTLHHFDDILPIPTLQDQPAERAP